jgi:hypothetical protein
MSENVREELKLRLGRAVGRLLAWCFSAVGQGALHYREAVRLEPFQGCPGARSFSTNFRAAHRGQAAHSGRASIGAALRQRISSSGADYQDNYYINVISLYGCLRECARRCRAQLPRTPRERSCTLCPLKNTFAKLRANVARKAISPQLIAISRATRPPRLRALSCSDTNARSTHNASPRKMITLLVMIVREAD